MRIQTFVSRFIWALKNTGETIQSLIRVKGACQLRSLQWTTIQTPMWWVKQEQVDKASWDELKNTVQESGAGVVLRSPGPRGNPTRGCYFRWICNLHLLRKIAVATFLRAWTWFKANRNQHKCEADWGGKVSNQWAVPDEPVPVKVDLWMGVKGVELQSFVDDGLTNADTPNF